MPAYWAKHTVDTHTLIGLQLCLSNASAELKERLSKTALLWLAMFEWKMENACQVYESHVWIGNLRFLISNPDSAKDSLCGPKHTSVPFITPLQYRVCGDQQENTTLCLGQAQPRGLISVPRNWGHCFENWSFFLSHLRRLNQRDCKAI